MVDLRWTKITKLARTATATSSNITRKSVDLTIARELHSILLLIYRRLRLIWYPFPLIFSTNFSCHGYLRQTLSLWLCCFTWYILWAPFVCGLNERKIACSRLSVSGVDRKSGRGTSGISRPSLFLYQTPLVARRPAAFDKPHWPRAWNRLEKNSYFDQGNMYYLKISLLKKISLPSIWSSFYFKLTILTVLKLHYIWGELAAPPPKAVLPTLSHSFAPAFRFKSEE